MQNNMIDSGATSKNYKRFAWISGTLLTISGLLYSVFQIVFFNKIYDKVFICLTIGESLFILFAGTWILGYISDNAKDFCANSKGKYHKKNVKVFIKLINIFGNFKYIIPIIVWALVMGILPVIQRYWEDNFSLTLMYGIFLFFTNIITAYFLVLLISFFVISIQLWNVVQVKLWRSDNIATTFIFSISKRIALFAAIYMTSSLTAWLTSPKIPFNPVIFVFIVFSIIILIGSIILPSIPYTKKKSKLKREALIDIDNKIQQEYSLVMKNIQDINDISLFNKMNLLIEMRRRIESIEVFPFRLKTITTSLFIIFISIIPVILEYAFKLFLGRDI
jgi:hypothetical protein